MKNGLKSRDFECRGVHHSGWWAFLFSLFDAADKGAIGRCEILSRKTHTITQKSRVSVIIYGGKVKGCRILLVLAEKCISVTENAVEKRGI